MLKEVMSSEPQLKNRPEDTPFKQQRLTSWQPILTPPVVIILFLVVGIIFIPVGVELQRISDDIYEDRIEYDNGRGPNSEGCGITTQNAGTTCTVTFTLTEDVSDELMVYYELNNFYQNHRRYVGSRSATQLMGIQVGESEMQLHCEALYKNGSYLLNPCGLIANSFFNDVISTSSVSLDETGIAWKSDRDKKFIQVEGFESAPKANYPGGTCPSGFSETNDKSGTPYCYMYPNENEYQYLYETYPQISPLDGVTDEHFIVWMRTAGLPNFRKLYGTIENQPLSKGDTIVFNITQNFDVSDFEGKKSIVISTVGQFGGKNPYLGVAYIVVGSVSLFFGCLFLIKHIFYPRQMGDLSKLHWQ